MKLLEQRTARLSLAVKFEYEDKPGKLVEQEEVEVNIDQVGKNMLFHGLGYWLFMDLDNELVTLSWVSRHYQNGDKVIDLSLLPVLAPVDSILLVAPPPVSISLSALPSGQVGEPYGAWVSTDGGKEPLYFEATNLPAGLSIDRSSGLISGIPAESIIVDVTINVRDTNGTYDEITITNTILD